MLRTPRGKVNEPAGRSVPESLNEVAISSWSAIENSENSENSRTDGTFSISFY